MSMGAVDGRFLGLKWSAGLIHVDTDVEISSFSLIPLVTVVKNSLFFLFLSLSPLSMYHSIVLMFLFSKYLTV